MGTVCVAKMSLLTLFCYKIYWYLYWCLHVNREEKFSVSYFSL